MTKYDAVVVGSGPNGLAAAITLAGAGVKTLVLEAEATPGGGARSLPLTRPGFVHDVCSTVHPLGVGSPFFQSLALDRFGLAWVYSPAPLAHVLSSGRAVLLERSIEDTVRHFPTDAEAYRELMQPLLAEFPAVLRSILGPLRWPASPLATLRFGLPALRSMRGLGHERFRDPGSLALFAGMAAHAMLPLEALGTTSFGLVLALAGHQFGWPLARGGSQSITNALIACLRELGGEIELGQRIEQLSQLPPASAYLFDVGPRQLSRIAGDALPDSFHRRLQAFRYGAGVFKIDWALRAPVPWRDPQCAKAATVHLAGEFDDIAPAEAAVHRGELVERPFVLFVQPSLFDDTRAPAGSHVAWAYCHVPAGSNLDATARIEAQIERFAPGFGSTILARATKDARQMEQQNPNYVGGDINGGRADLSQLFFRPTARIDPYATPAPNLFLCSSSTPPGGGVHGMCGYFAARSALRRVFGTTLPELGQLAYRARNEET